ncbi:Predicted ferric reductase [Nocardioides terrae]|uniref:Predicted ferric reductase n=1 Tax=Nocardioides terrae TaxID=574651 RepID=A0A1I1MGZ9_9ACTN|nr:ferredoxin reductase family protein [Nocardioides terrae]SFC84082.1 Predicted ferric reductase [Nocardioides terrae]
MTTTAAPVALGSTTRLRAQRDAVVRLLAGAVLWLALLLVTYWWVADGGIQDLGGWADGLTSAGRVSGLWSAVLLLAQVVLMARVPVIEGAFGQDRLARTHRLVGLVSSDLMVIHVVLVTWGYAAGRLVAVPGTFWDLTVDYPGMLLAVAGTACLVLVVVTSVKAARRRLRYESWHLMHLYAYLGVGLALPHQLWTGAQFLSRPAATVFWWTAWAAAAGSVLVWRIGVPVIRNLRHGLRVDAVVPEAPGVLSVWVSGRRLDLLRAEAGQFLMWRFLGRRGWTRANPYSLSAAPDGRRLRITVEVVGDGSAALAALRPGTRVLVEGPFGRLSERARTRRKVALVGAGVGVVPLRALAEGLAYGPGEAVLLHRYRDEPLFRGEMEALAGTRGLRIVGLPGSRRSESSWLPVGSPPIDDARTLLGLVPDLPDRDVFVCGPPGWTDSVTRAATAAGVPTDHLHVETFGW